MGTAANSFHGLDSLIFCGLNSLRLGILVPFVLVILDSLAVLSTNTFDVFFGLFDIPSLDVFDMLGADLDLFAILDPLALAIVVIWPVFFVLVLTEDTLKAQVQPSGKISIRFSPN